MMFDTQIKKLDCSSQIFPNMKRKKIFRQCQCSKKIQERFGNRVLT